MNMQKHFRCGLTLVNGSVITTVGTINNNRIICDPFQVRKFNLEIAIINRSLLDFLRKRCWTTKFIIRNRMEGLSE